MSQIATGLSNNEGNNMTKTISNSDSNLTFILRWLCVELFVSQLEIKRGTYLDLCMVGGAAVSLTIHQILFRCHPRRPKLSVMEAQAASFSYIYKFFQRLLFCGVVFKVEFHNLQFFF